MMHSTRILFIIILSLVLLAGCQKEKEVEQASTPLPMPVANYALSADGVPIYYSVDGIGSPAILFIHGWSCDRSYWEAQMTSFRTDHKVVAVDLAGHGESGRGRTNYTNESFANDVLAVIDHLGLDKVVLVGHSMGGVVMIEVARKRPETIIGLVGADTLHDLGEEWDFEKFIAPFREDFKKQTDKFVRDMFPETADQELVRWIAEDMSSAPREVGLSAMEGMDTYWRNELFTALKEIKIPLICINCDRWETKLDVNMKHAPTYELILMPGVGHFVMMEDPKRFNLLLADALRKIKSVTAPQV